SVGTNSRPAMQSAPISSRVARTLLLSISHYQPGGHWRQPVQAQVTRLLAAEKGGPLGIRFPTLSDTERAWLERAGAGSSRVTQNACVRIWFLENLPLSDSGRCLDALSTRASFLSFDLREGSPMSITDEYAKRAEECERLA